MPLAFICIAFTIGFIGLYRQVIGKLTGYIYGDQEDITIRFVQPHLPTWLVPHDEEAILALWESSFEGVPWRAWLVPLFALGGTFTLFYLVTAFLIGMFH